MWSFDSTRFTFDSTECRYRWTGPHYRSAWVQFRDVGGVIGYRRARTVCGVEPAPDGPYSVSGTSYQPAVGPPVLIYADAQTDFGNMPTRGASAVALVLAGIPRSPNPIGALWLGPDQLVLGSPPIVATAADIPAALTVRDRVCMLLRF